MPESSHLPAFDPDGAAIGDGIFGLPHTPEEASVVLLPVPWEATVSYRAGTADGPDAILRASRQVDLFDRETGEPWRAGISLLPISGELRAWSDGARRLASPLIEAGGVARPDLDHPTETISVEAAGCETGDDLLSRALAVDRLCAAMMERVRAAAQPWIEAGKLVGLIGGDHSTPLPLIQELARRHPGLGILHLDAHADLRPAYEGLRYSHASIMHNVLESAPGVARIVQVGIRDFCGAEDAAIRSSGGRVQSWFDADLQRRGQDGEHWSSLAREVVAALPAEVYLSFDVDGLDPGLCPHTGTPVPGGLSFAQAVALLRAVVSSGRRIIGFDLVETAPGPDGEEWDGNVAARLLYRMIGFALQSRNASSPPLAR